MYAMVLLSLPGYVLISYPLCHQLLRLHRNLSNSLQRTLVFSYEAFGENSLQQTRQTAPWFGPFCTLHYRQPLKIESVGAEVTLASEESRMSPGRLREQRDMEDKFNGLLLYSL